MKLFYFGSICSDTIFAQTVAQSRVKPSISAQNFEYALMKGFSGNPRVCVTAVSAESVASFPYGNRLFLKRRQDVITSQITAHIVPAVNLPGIKQFNHANGVVRMFKKWWTQIDCPEEACVLVYGLYPKVVERLQKVCRKTGCKIYAIITDVPSTMFTYTKSKGLFKRLFSGSYRKTAVSLQDKFDGYIFLTEAMKDEVAPGKPYTVVETIADPTIFDEIIGTEKSEPPVLMYAGSLYKKYGVDLIVDTFECLKSKCELWLLGSGDYEEEILERARNNPNIKFFGRVARVEVLKREKQASLLLNIRNAEDVYTKYSFPSKMIEYMLSGTPLFTSKLSGIPDEYYSYCYTTDAKEAQMIAMQIDNILAQDDFLSLGTCARQFVIDRKNSSVQCDRIIDFITDQK